MEQLSNYFLSLVQHTGYAGLFLAMVLGNLAIPAGTEIILPVVGMLAATGHTYFAPAAFGVALAGEIVGGSLLWAIGRYGGVAFVHRFGRYIHLEQSSLDRVHGFYTRFGNRTVFFCRFIPVIRGVAGLPAGLSGMSIFPFIGYTLLGSSIFCGGFIALGYFLGRRFSTLMPMVHKLGLGVFLIALVAIVIGVVIQRRRSTTP